MAAKYPIPSSDKILAMSCTNVGVGPGGTTAMLAFVIRIVHCARFVYKTYFIDASPSWITRGKSSLIHMYPLPCKLATTAPLLRVLNLPTFSLVSSSLQCYLFGVHPITSSADTPAFSQVQQLVADRIKGKVLVGHSLWNDLSGKHNVHSIAPGLMLSLQF
jgi:RNA exonuclease 4